MSEPSSPLAASLLQKLSTLPFATAELPPIQGRLKESLTDFEVEEIPAYAPSGEGEHLYLWIEKRDINTQDAVRALAAALGTPFEGAGFAGLKDKRAVARQWISLHHPDTPAPERLQLPQVRVLESTRHANKLRTGHLRGNRFRLLLRGVAQGDEDRAAHTLSALATRGMPNYYGAQRFGQGGKNLAAAYAFLVDGGRPPHKPFLRKLLMSSLQAALFNAWLAERITSGQFGQVVAGDVLRKEDSGGLFLCNEPERDQERMQSWEISPTGPMFGSRMKSPEGAELAIEAELLTRWGVSEACLKRAERYGEGTRRPARVRPEAARCERLGEDLLLEFSLPKGSYATVLVEELTKSRAVAPDVDL